MISPFEQISIKSNAPERRLGAQINYRLMVKAGVGFSTGNPVLRDI